MRIVWVMKKAALHCAASVQRTPAMEQVLAPSTALCRRVLDADALHFAMPMPNAHDRVRFFLCLY